MLKVAIDSGPLSSGDSVRGKGVYVRELLNALKMEGVDVSKEDLSKYDVVHFTYFNPFFVSIPFSKPKNTKFVLTIYDLIPLIYPKHYPPGIKGWIRWQINKYLIKRNVDAIITISETSKKDICRFMGIAPEKVHVIYLAPAEEYKHSNTVDKNVVKEKFHLPGRFIFCFGDINYNKNIVTLIKACDLLKIPLVLAGKQITEVGKMDLEHPENRHLKEILRYLKNSSLLIRPGYVTDSEAAAMYTLSDVYVQPSFYEGFGLSLVHAFSCGTPVICAKTQALVEIADDAALYADPLSADSFVEKIKLIIGSPKIKTELIAKGYERVKEFSWEVTAEETLEVYKNV